MKSPILKERFVNAWGGIMVFTLVVTSTVLLNLSFISYPEFPKVPKAVWVTYFVFQVLNVLPIGHEYRSSKANNIEIACYVFGLICFVLSILYRNNIASEYWFVFTLGIAIWLSAGVYFYLKNYANEYPLANRITALIVGTLTKLPMLTVCILALKNSA